jgi:hypothetical protein
MSGVYKSLKAFCDQNGITFLTKEEQYYHRDKVEILATVCKHSKKIFIGNLRKLHGIRHCDECSPYAKLTHEKCAKVFEDNGCKINITKEGFEINDMNISSNIEYYATCGHLNNTRFSHFKSDGYGRLCDKCTKENASINTLARYEDNKMLCQETELVGYNIFKELVQDEFDVLRTYEGCLADVIIKPKNIESDEWISVQLKSTKGKGSQNRYMFVLQTEYKNMVLCCISNSDQKIWLFDSQSIPKVGSLGITKNNESSKSKYDKFETDASELSNNLKGFYLSETHVTKKDGMTPISESCKTELKYRLLREQKMDFAKFEYPGLHCSVWDFKLNGFKVQEKTLISEKKGIGLKAHFNKHGGKNKERMPYEEGDNQFYIYHYQDQNKFYLLPEIVLINDGIVKTRDCAGKKQMVLYPMLSLDEAKQKKYKTADYNKYIYSYDSPEDMAKVKTIFGL